MFNKKLVRLSMIYSHDKSYEYMRLNQSLIRNFDSLILLMSFVGYVC